MTTDAIVMLKQDHQDMRKLFRQFDKLGDGAHKRRGEVATKIIEALTVHTYLENEVMYPEVRALMPDVEDDILESYEEHHVVDLLCLELDAMKPEHERFTAKMTVLKENVTHHMDEEEQDWFPKVREGLGRKALQDMGARMVEMRRTAPRRPTEPKAIKKAVDAVTA